MLSELEKQLQLDYFLNNGFHRLQCQSCKSWFWTLDKSQTLCGDQPCVEYSFIGNPLTRRPYQMAEMRERFLGFFEERQHTRVPRYPVVARWRTDIYLTIASIADFQPFVTSGEVPPPANPLCISQPCIRLNDLANVGKSGRHMTQFEMMAHHAFNRPGHEIYWADKTVEYCDTFLTKSLDIPRERITYKENPWAGGGNAGPAVEVLAGGLEVATLVFMNLKADPHGTIDVKGDKYSQLDLQIVDTGWGLERLTWASQGNPTAYDATMPEMIQFLRKYTAHSIDLEDPRVRTIASEHARLAGVMSLDAESNLHELRQGVAKRLSAKGVTTDADELQKLMSPIEDLYALADHAKCLSFMLGDGIVPSNVRAGYLCRLILRRTIRLMESLQLDMKLRELVLKQLEVLQPDFPELRQEELTIAEILDLEQERYRETIEKGTRLIQGKLKRGQSLGPKELIELYDSQGLPPQVVRQVAEKVGVKVDIPDAFDTMVAERHSKEEQEAPTNTLPVQVSKPTRTLYYETPQEHEFDATVLWSDDTHVVLDQTLFYPEGGGQPCDLGTLAVGDKIYKVKDVQKQNGVIIHTTSGGKMKVGEIAHGRVDWDRRLAHMRHHTATHIMRGAAQAVLGNHVWQSGAQKAENYARLDLTHFKRLTTEEVRQIEAIANDVVMRNIHLERVFLERNVAERKFGVRLYQGGVPPGNLIRVVRIGDHDVESCAGTHVDETSDVGPIKIYKTERIQDGIERLEYAAGPAAVRIMQERERILDDSARALSVPVEKLPVTVERFFTEWKQRGKEIEELRERLSQLQVKELLSTAQTHGNVRLVVHVGEADELQPLANHLVQSKGVVAILAARQGSSARLLVARSPDVTHVHAGEIVRKACALMGGSGGGKPEMAQGGGTTLAKLDEALALAKSEVVRLVAAS